MIQESELSSLLFFDLETSSEYDSLETLLRENPRKGELWKEKCAKAAAKDKKWEDPYRAYKEQAPLNAEYGRIVCGSFCYIGTVSENGKMKWVGKMKSFYDNQASDTSETDQVLKPISDLLYNIDRAGKQMRLCGHNIKRFDIPWLVKRMTIREVPVPVQLQVWGKKPWEITHLDTGELWSVGSFDGYVSLDTLTCVLGIPSPKDKMKGEYVGRYFHEDKRYDDIAAYCEEDVRAGARICHKLSGSILPISLV